MEFHLPEYDFDEFGEIVVRLAADRYQLGREIACKNSLYGVARHGNKGCTRCITAHEVCQQY